jgi:hypothetical protein
MLGAQTSDNIYKIAIAQSAHVIAVSVKLLDGGPLHIPLPGCIVIHAINNINYVVRI